MISKIQDKNIIDFSGNTYSLEVCNYLADQVLARYAYYKLKEVSFIGIFQKLTKE